uniref:Uncharacterized protein n=1 Tax=Entomoneis paludosa TaxID=265537 RepID=A0A7S2YCR4_9STRA|mmetsp:Transcript_27645/g.57845  ORF Transcript_27645/g.57845 Transcript_27645/m.57845 type:complete len:112 (+) Transcript_27645:34-369(+)
MVATVMILLSEELLWIHSCFDDCVYPVAVVCIWRMSYRYSVRLGKPKEVQVVPLSIFRARSIAKLTNNGVRENTTLIRIDGMSSQVSGQMVMNIVSFVLRPTVVVVAELLP